jgi:electron transfer flavoprotein alpha subunit
VTVFCLVEVDGGGVVDASLRALTLARRVAAQAGDGLADGASAVVAAGTDRGNEVLAHVGAITGLPMAANCVAVSAGSGGSFEIVRQRWAGLLLEEAVLDAPTALLTAATDAGTAAPADAPGAAIAHEVAAAGGLAAPTGSGRWTSSRRSSAAWSGSRGW